MGALFFAVIGLSIVALALRNDYTRRRARRKGVQVTAHVVAEDAESSLGGTRTLHTTVRFWAPEGNWIEDVPVRGHLRPHRQGDTVDVWYDSSDPTFVTADEPGARRALFFWLAVGLVILVSGLSLIINPG
jgi:hypothetical protein